MVIPFLYGKCQSDNPARNKGILQKGKVEKQEMKENINLNDSMVNKNNNKGREGKGRIQEEISGYRKERK